MIKNPFLNEEFAKFFDAIGNTFLYKNSVNCRAYIYKRRINLFSFAKFMPEFPVTFPIIGIPASIESPGIS
ncbi:hypothetical protein KAJ27_24050, partial [bacterium]|nr:hypothetical protein [bacterium]